jgi:hypothetical protein
LSQEILIGKEKQTHLEKYLFTYTVLHAGLAGTGAASGIGISGFELSVRCPELTFGSALICINFQMLIPFCITAS